MDSRSFWKTCKEFELRPIISKTGNPSLDLMYHCFVFSGHRGGFQRLKLRCCILHHGRSESLHSNWTTDTLQRFFQRSADSTLIDSEWICLFCAFTGGQHDEWHESELGELGSILAGYWKLSVAPWLICVVLSLSLHWHALLYIASLCIIFPSISSVAISRWQNCKS